MLRGYLESNILCQVKKRLLCIIKVIQIYVHTPPPSLEKNPALSTESEMTPNSNSNSLVYLHAPV